MESVKELLTSDWFYESFFKVFGITLSVLTVIAAGYAKWIRRDNLKNISEAFTKTVQGLAAPKIEERIASAIILRRFLDEKTEYGVGGAPFAETAVSVISAVLKHAPTSDFQKVLADSLAHAPARCLIKGDFQRANLSKAYLGNANFKEADFFQSTLSGASLKGAILSKTIFREATLRETILRDAKLQNANFSFATLQSVSFSGADLSNAVFDGATLREVDFSGAKLDGASFLNAYGYGNKNAPAGIEQRLGRKNQKRIFISRPGQLDSRQKLFVDSTKSFVAGKGFEFVELDRNCYDAADVLTKLHGKVSECCAMIAFGFHSVYIKEGVFRIFTTEATPLSAVHLSTPWSHAEIAMAAGLQMPILALVDDGIEDGVFGSSVNDRLLTKQNVQSSLNCQGGGLDKWLDSLGDR